MPPANDNHPYVVELDLYIARRRRLHEVRRPDGIAVFHAAHVVQVLDWLVDNDIGSAEFTDDETTFLVTFKRKPSPPPPMKDNHNG